MIINNIDVSECEHLTETRHCKAQMAVMGTDANKCKCFPNCYYKQLKRKEQKLDKITTICEKETTKSTFCNGIENKDSQKLAIKILKIIIGGK